VLTASPFAATPRPPYYSVVFASQRRPGNAAEYDAAAARMVALAAAQPGFLGVESARDASGFGITVSYWDSEAAILAWKRNAEHAEVRASGRRDWYAHYELRVARVERAYGLHVADAISESADAALDGSEASR
jgi:heme-degrading monooxygenase HmoA